MYHALWLVDMEHVLWLAGGVCFLTVIHHVVAKVGTIHSLTLIHSPRFDKERTITKLHLIYKTKHVFKEDILIIWEQVGGIINSCQKFKKYFFFMGQIRGTVWGPASGPLTVFWSSVRGWVNTCGPQITGITDAYIHTYIHTYWISKNVLD